MFGQMPPLLSTQDSILGSQVSGWLCNAAITGLQVAGRMRSGETVLVTAAAGGVGQFVVQLAKQAGNTVIATCGSENKARLLRRLGADRIVNYRQESLKDVLRTEFPKVSTPAGAGQSQIVSWSCWPALSIQWRGAAAQAARTSHTCLRSRRGANPCTNSSTSALGGSSQDQSLQWS